MKTIACVFVSNREISLEAAKKHKPYTFNTEDPLIVGDVLSVESYSSLLMVVKIHQQVWRYFNPENGVLNNVMTDTYSGIIRELSLEDKEKTNYTLVKTHR